MLVSRIHFIYDLSFELIKDKFSEFIETKISPDEYIYCNEFYFLTIKTKKRQTILTIEDSNLSFPSNNLNIRTIPIDDIIKGIIPDKILIDLNAKTKYIKYLVQHWGKHDNYYQQENFRLLKRQYNNSTFYSISTQNIFTNYTELVNDLYAFQHVA